MKLEQRFNPQQLTVIMFAAALFLYCDVWVQLLSPPRYISHVTGTMITLFALGLLTPIVVGLVIFSAAKSAL